MTTVAHQDGSGEDRPPFAEARAERDGGEGGGALLQAELALPVVRRGKVRDVFALPEAGAGAVGETARKHAGAGGLLIVASDRISAFDVVMPTPIPGKGRLLTEISTHWFRFIERRRLTGTHLLSVDVAEVPDEAFLQGEDGGGGTTRADLAGRVTIGRRCAVIPVECVVRGYLEGSGWADYQRTGAVCGVRLPAGLVQCGALPEPIFTPATKAEQGEHDENITFDRACDLVGRRVMEVLRRRSLAIYAAACEEALGKGIIIADTKFEFGLPVDARGEPTSDDPILIDEALTPDSSRFWPAASYEPGRAQPSFDKQFLREYLQGLVDGGQWDKRAPGVRLPAEVVERTLEKYREARDRLVG